MSRVNDGRIRQDHQLGMDTGKYLVIATTREIRSTYTGIKQCISGEDYSLTEKANSSRAMAGSMQNKKVKITGFYSVTALEKAVGWGDLHWRSKHASHG